MSLERKKSTDSLSSVSTTSLMFDRIDEREKLNPSAYDDEDRYHDEDGGNERGPFFASASRAVRGMDRNLRRLVIIFAIAIAFAWGVGLATYITSQSYKHRSSVPHDPAATSSRGSGKKITMGQIQSGMWQENSHEISWIAGPNGEDGYLLEQGAEDKEYLVVEDVRGRKSPAAADDHDHPPTRVKRHGPALPEYTGEVMQSLTLMKTENFDYAGQILTPERVWPSKDLKKVLIATHIERNWRHSFLGVYWIFDVKTQKATPLDPDNITGKVQLASWSPKSDAVIFTRDNNLFLRQIASSKVVKITKDGGPEYFYGIPDWVYEEEVFGGNSATWWSDDGLYAAFLRTNETLVPEYPIQYFVSRPSGTQPEAGMESYPETRKIKYPKAGSPNPVVDLLFYDVTRGDFFSVDISGGFADDNRLITEVIWARDKVLVKEINRVSDIMRVVLVDVVARKGKTVRTDDVGKIDGGWFEISQKTKFVPADPAKGRPYDGYIDTVIHNDGDHLAYFSPLDKPDPLMLTTGPNWEVVDAPSAVDLDNNLVYFIAAKESSTARGLYSVTLNGTNLQTQTDTKQGYYEASFSSSAGYVLLTYHGPDIPWQKVMNTLGNSVTYEQIIELNRHIAENSQKYELPIKKRGTIEVDGVELNYVERRPPHFNEKKKYPVLFQQYSGPGSQSVNQKFSVTFQEYVAANLGYIVVTVDGRGTGFIGRKNRVLVRGKLGEWESHDQIAAAKEWAAKSYVDSDRIGIWGWSYGGFMTLKTLEQDAGQTFKYGMAVAPVTDWRFYDSIYTERYMLTPQQNQEGYSHTAIHNASALAQNVRFLIMHGTGDDNVHMQSTLTLLDKLDLAGVENYDVHVFPDSDHGIYYHNANKIVYDKLNNWLINAFNGEWLKVDNPTPIAAQKRREAAQEIAKRSGITVTGGGGAPLSLLSGVGDPYATLPLRG